MVMRALVTRGYAGDDRSGRDALAELQTDCLVFKISSFRNTKKMV